MSATYHTGFGSTTHIYGAPLGLSGWRPPCHRKAETFCPAVPDVCETGGRPRTRKIGGAPEVARRSAFSSTFDKKRRGEGKVFSPLGPKPRGLPRSVNTPPRTPERHVGLVPPRGSPIYLFVPPDRHSRTFGAIRTDG
ncbi:hypothetical protein EYF80_041470 [Liparis tanakae]|uniref:Uncharacterized protein n=1 Tax=Liparis tanakae TaxID=230148 RepID=A0A4Z2G447_9TELE|nr:hypothetical protein EYF80_041470 [Liparis tanakae]